MPAIHKEASMSERPRGEKEEEKEEEKRHEKQEKSWEEKWRQDPVGTFVWACIFIWAGLVLLAANTGYLTRLAERWGLPRLGTWSVILAGAGALVIVGVLLRLLIPSLRRAVLGALIVGAVLIGVGLHEVVGWDAVWPSILIVVGISILLRGVLFRRR